jgi:FkbM family methyltransferase
MTVRRRLRAAAKKWRRTLFELAGSDRYSHFAINNLDYKLATHIPYRDGVFIEAGANDGLTQSNTYWFERFRGWRGILIEPIPAMAAACLRNRPRATVINSALVSTEETKSVRMQTARLMAFVSKSFARPEDEKRHLQTAIEVQQLESVAEIEVPARTLSSILSELGVTRVDLLSLDVEGYEVEVLKGLDTARHLPQFILVETGRLPEVLEALEGRYDAIDQLSHHDHLLKARTPLSSQEAVS